MCFCAGSFVLIGEVILYLIRHFFMMKKLEDGLCLLHVDTEELTVLVDALRVKGFMKGFFNFETITFFDLARKFTLKRTGTPVVYSSFIRLSMPSCVVMPIFTSPGHRVCQKINYSVFHIVVFLETIVQFVFVCNEIKNSFKFAHRYVAVLVSEYI